MNGKNDESNTSLDLLCQLSIVTSNLSFLYYYALNDYILGITVLEEAFMVRSFYCVIETKNSSS